MQKTFCDMCFLDITGKDSFKLQLQIVEKEKDPYNSEKTRENYQTIRLLLCRDCSDEMHNVIIQKIIERQKRFD